MSTEKMIGQRIRSMRKERNWTQEKLAEEANVSTNHVGNVERADKSVSLHTLDKVAKALNTSLEELSSGTTSASKKILPETQATLLHMFSKQTHEDQQNAIRLLNIFFDSINKKK